LSNVAHLTVPAKTLWKGNPYSLALSVKNGGALHAISDLMIITRRFIFV